MFLYNVECGASVQLAHDFYFRKNYCFDNNTLILKLTKHEIDKT